MAEGNSLDGAEPFPSQLYEPENEVAVLGCLLHANGQADRVAEILTPEDFAEPLFGEIYGMILREVAAGRPAIISTIAPMFAQDARFQDLDGRRLLIDAAGSTFALFPAIQFAKAVREIAVRRRLWLSMRDTLSQLEDLAVPTVDALAQHESALITTSAGGDDAKPLHFGDAWDRTMAGVDAIAAGTAPRGVRVAGFPEWGDVTNGMHAGQMILLGGRPGMGKTAVATKVAVGAAEAGHGVQFISIEMPVDQLMLRIIADKLFEHGSRATFDDVQNGRLSVPDRALADRIRKSIDDSPLVFEEPAGLNANRIAPMIRRAQRTMQAKGQRLELVVLDYLGLVGAPKTRQSVTNEVSDVSRLVKQAARSCGVAIVALAQLNRSVESREDKHPMLSDLRDSGSLEQDADTVVFAYRGEYYLRQTEPQEHELKYEAWRTAMETERDRLEIYSAKVRQGAVARRRCFFFGGRQAVRSADFYRTGGGGVA